MIPPFLLDVLCCPACRADVCLEMYGLQCTACQATYPIRRGIPRFVANDGYARNFSYEWKRWRTVQVDSLNGRDESAKTFREKTGFTEESLAGRTVLDVGCGSGRFLDVASRWGANVIGVDYSFAVDAAAENLRGRANVALVQADVFRLPFKDGAFDAVFSIGVLHHTHDTRAAFGQLPRLLNDGGTIAVWLYHYTDRLYCAATDAWRFVFRHVPHRLVYVWCWLLVAALSGLYRRPFMRRRPWSLLRRLVPVDTHPLFAWRVLDTFDWYTPRYQDKRCSAARTMQWFRDAGLRYIEALDAPTAVRGRRVASARAPEVLTPLLDVTSKRLVVFGAGAAGRQAVIELRGLAGRPGVVGLCDNDPATWGRVIEGITVRSFATIPRHHYDAVVIASQSSAAIAMQLERAGLAPGRDFAPLQFVSTERVAEAA